MSPVCITCHSCAARARAVLRITPRLVGPVHILHSTNKAHCGIVNAHLMRPRQVHSRTITWMAPAYQPAPFACPQIPHHPGYPRTTPRRLVLIPSRHHLSVSIPYDLHVQSVLSPSPHHVTILSSEAPNPHPDPVLTPSRPCPHPCPIPYHPQPVPNPTSRQIVASLGLNESRTNAFRLRAVFTAEECEHALSCDGVCDGWNALSLSR